MLPRGIGPLWLSAALLCLKAQTPPLAVNTGTVLALEPGGIVWCAGGWQNNPGGSFINQGTVYITGDIRNDDPNGFFAPSASPGTLVLNGLIQTLSGQAPIRTDTLRLLGREPKILATTLYIDQVLDLGEAELRTQAHTASVRNPDPAAIRRQSGFVSSEAGGALERRTDRSAIYLFPVGGHTPLRYRPVEITPTSAAPHRFAVRLANVDPNAEGRPRDQLHPDLCQINSLYHHYVNRIEGTSAAELRFYYEPGDPVIGPIAQWKTVLWTPTSATDIPNGWRLVGWNDFQDPYFAFSERRLRLSLTASRETIEVGAPVTLTASSQPSSATYQWDFGDGTTLTGSGTQNYTYTTPGIYTVQVSAPPCSDTARRQIVVRSPSQILIPTAFTPNGDGINEFWQPLVQGEVRRLQWWIYDRWGTTVAQGEGRTTRWDGRKNGQPCPEGVYVYVVEAILLDGETFRRSGTLTLLR
ncbi:MAG: gliding motility-associated C-terminal domain-containing protein [Bacteroidia bacterium]|nr:gliding motility-associated C-terminal domain-containing protein [Bacteroidia bacterium]MDW8089456.1 gliding motility-associated C-terminal domain-containing protein [Bacteroidia bacterium]